MQRAGKTFAALLLTCVAATLFWQLQISYFRVAAPLATVSHSIVRLQPVQDIKNAIHYLETSGTSVVRLEHLCALESAAFHNNANDVVLSLLSETLALTPALELLTANYHNLHFAFLDIETRLHGTAAQLGVRSGVEGLLDAIRASHYRVSNYMVYSTIIKGYSINPTLLPVYQQQIANQHCPLH
jgi:hypothetical protein